MPLDVVRLRDSDLAIGGTGEGFRAAVLLWCASWHQRPAASLPDNDRVLAGLAGYGRDLDSWHAVKVEALHNFIGCSDGRLYHPVIAAKALEAWERKQGQRKRTAAATEARRKRDVHRNDDVTVSVAPTVTSTKGQGQGQGTVDIDRGIERERAGGGLMALIHEAFMARGVNGLVMSAAQLVHVQRLARIAGSQVSDPRDWCRRYLNTAWELRAAGKDVWRGQPWAPSAICSEKMMIRVQEAMAGGELTDHDRDLWAGVQQQMTGGVA